MRWPKGHPFSILTDFVKLYHYFSLPTYEYFRPEFAFNLNINCIGALPYKSYEQVQVSRLNTVLKHKVISKPSQSLACDIHAKIYNHIGTKNKYIMYLYTYIS